MARRSKEQNSDSKLNNHSDSQNTAGTGEESKSNDMMVENVEQHIENVLEPSSEIKNQSNFPSQELIELNNLSDDDKDNSSKKQDILKYNKSPDRANNSNSENNRNRKSMPQDSDNNTVFSNIPESGNLHSIIYMTDSDSNTDGTDKILNTSKPTDIEDQCVPVIKQYNKGYDNHSNSNVQNNSCEPMDIDETLPENSIVNNLDDNNKSNLNDYFNKKNIGESEEQNDNLSTTVTRKKSSQYANSSNVYSATNVSQEKDKDSSYQNITENETHILRKSLRHSLRNSGEMKDLNVSQTEKSLLCESQSTSLLNNSNKSQKLSLSNSKMLDNSNIEDKNSLILSHLKNNSQSQSLNILSTSITKNEVGKGKKVSLNNSQNTPLKHKNMQQLGIQTSTPNTEHDKLEKKLKKSNKENSQSISDSENYNMKGKYANNLRNNSENSEKLNEDVKKIRSTLNSHDTSNSESSDENDSQSPVTLLDDEAEEANDSYESGDSQDEEDRQYERENEIIEKGETLTSEEDISDDSDYEKDSFVVSSSEDELLSGSGDDLDMSDNVLTMSATSKDKYNKRKDKERKKASREMYEARHSLNNSKSKHNHLRINSSMDNSQEEEVVIPKKNRRRIDSTLDSSSNDTEINKTKSRNNSKLNSTSEIESKNKIQDRHSSQRLSKSIKLDDDSTIKNNNDESSSKAIIDEADNNENEITISNLTVREDDPLQTSVQNKTESESQKKNMNTSTVNCTIREEIEEMEVDENVFVINHDSLSKKDPLGEDYVENDESDSNDEAIMDNYNSMLKDLNKVQGKKTNKFMDASLNLDKKSKKKNGPPIVDELNLTVTKKPKNKDKLKQINENSKNLLKNTEDPSSDSIDLKLFFSRESDNDSDSDSEHKLSEQVTTDINTPCNPLTNSENKYLQKDCSDNVSIDGKY